MRGTLSEAQETVQLQAGQIEPLKICLDGVAEALDYVIYGLYGAAINALTRVKGACNEAFTLFRSRAWRGGGSWLSQVKVSSREAPAGDPPPRTPSSAGRAPR